VKAPDKRSAIQLRIQRYALGKFLGSYRSLFRGKGMDYDEIRKYVPGDDPKAFVWAKLAQLGEPYVKTFLEERDLSVIIALDTSGSIFWPRPEKSQIALEAAAALIFSAAISRDRVGLALFSDHLEQFIAPRRGLAQAGKLIETLNSLEPRCKNTFLAQSLHAISSRRGPKRAAIIVISDFMSHDEGWRGALSSMSKHNDVIAIKVIDGWELDPPQVGWVYAADSETGQYKLVHCDKNFAASYKDQLATQRRELARFSAQHNIGHIELLEGEDPVRVMKAFFDQRRKLLGRSAG
jgi:uncharacterized protein (DUF58 family)